MPVKLLFAWCNLCSSLVRSGLTCSKPAMLGLSTSTWSAWSMRCRKWWATTTIGMCNSRAKFLSNMASCLVDAVSRPELGLSKNKMACFPSNVLAMAIRWRWPPLAVFTWAPYCMSLSNSEIACRNSCEESSLWSWAISKFSMMI